MIGRGYMKDILITVLSIVIMIYVILKNRKIIKQLIKFQIFGVGISYLFTIFIAFILVYYGGNWIAGQFSNTFFKYIIFFAVVCIALYLCVNILNKVLQKITNGILPKS